MHFAISQDLRAVFAGRQKADGSPFVALEKNPHPDPFARSRLLKLTGACGRAIMKMDFSARANANSG